ncbi:MAG: glycosyltransferase, partial [Anaerolineae bacterium]|nr:glycosyltransferase [Anaerolineae bacterium]
MAREEGHELTLAVVIVSYNVRDLLRACLRATLASLARSGFALQQIASGEPETGEWRETTGEAAARETNQDRRAMADQPPTAAVIVVDNASADGSAAMVAAEFPQVQLIASATNLGFTAGNNLALRLLGFDHPPHNTYAVRSTPYAVRRTPYAVRSPHYILLLNPDAEPLDDAIGQMARFLAAHPDVGGVGAQLQYPDGRFQ